MMDALSPFSYIIGGIVVLGVLLWLALRTFRFVDSFDRLVVLKLGNFAGVRGPGFVIVLPFVESVYDTVDMRVTNEQIEIDALTRDTVAIKVKAIVFQQVFDARAYALDVMDADHSIELAAETALRNAIGSCDLATVLSDRASVDRQVQSNIEVQAKAWGIHVQSVDINDIELPEALNNAMSQGAQAHREAAARTMLADSEVVIAEKFLAAAKVYDSDPTALQLRAMNLAYEAIKTGQTNTVLLPATGLDGLAAIATRAGISGELSHKEGS